MKKRERMALMLLFGFLLGIRNGYIALWKDEDPEPVRVFPYLASSLPERDRIALEQGIRIDNTTDLSRLLEDFLS